MQTEVTSVGAALDAIGTNNAAVIESVSSAREWRRHIPAAAAAAASTATAVGQSGFMQWFMLAAD